MAQEQLQLMEAALASTLSNNNAEREHAETVIEQFLRERPAQWVQVLAALLGQSGQAFVRNSCAVLLRKRLAVGEPILYDRLEDGTKAALRAALLQSLLREPEPFLRKQVADTVAELAQAVAYRKDERGVPEWPELFAEVLDPAKAGVTTLVVLHRLADASPDVLEEHVEHCVAVYDAGLSHADPAVRVQAALASIVHSCSLEDMGEDQVHTEVFQRFVPVWMTLFAECLSRGAGDDAEKLIQALSDLAADFSRFFRPHLEAVSALMLQAGQSHQVPVSVRRAVCQFFVHVCTDAEVMARRSPSVVRNGIAVALSLMLTVEEVPGWERQPEPVIERDLMDEDEPCDAGEAALDAVCSIIRRKKVLPVLTPIITDFLSRNDWRYRHVGIKALGSANDLFTLDEVPVERLCDFFRDPHPRVAYAALHVAGLLATDHAPDLQASSHHVMVRRLLDVIGDQRQPRLQTQATHALFNFVEDGKPESIRPYMQPLITALFGIIPSAQHSVVAGCLTVVASMAGKLPREFCEHYDSVMPFLVRLVKTADRVEDRPLRARAMEAATFTGMAVGDERFRADGVRLMEVFMPILERGHSADDPSFTYMLNACTRICSVLREEYVPYLPGVLRHVFDMARVRVDGIIELVKAGAETSLIMRQRREDSYNLEDKVTGLQMLSTFMGVLSEGAHYLPFLKPTAELVLPLLDSQKYEVREVCIGCTGDIVLCAVEAVRTQQMTPEDAAKVFTAVTMRLHQCLEKEKSISAMQALAGAISACVHNAGPALAPAWMSGAQLDALTNALMQMLRASVERVRKREARLRDDKTLDEEAQADLRSYNETENQLSYCVSESVSALVKNLREHYMPQFARLYPLLMEMASPQAPLPAIVTSLFILDDVMEHIGRAAAEYLRPVMTLLLGWVMDERYQIRQAAAFGVGVCAQSMGDLFEPYLDEAAQRLMAAVALPGARDAENASAADNCISALGRIMSYQQQNAAGRLAPHFLNMLPLTADVDEGPLVYGVLLTMAEHGSPELLGEGMRALPKVVAVLAHVFRSRFAGIPDEDAEGDGADTEISKRIARFFASLRAQLPADAFQSLVSMLPKPTAELFVQIAALGASASASSPGAG